MISSVILATALLAQHQTVLSQSQLATIDHRTWIESSVADFRDGMFDPGMYASHRAGLDPDAGCVEFFARFDLDNNGYFDLVCADDSGPYLRVYFGSETGYSTSHCRRFEVPGGGGVDFVDLNCDGYAELVHSGWRSGRVVIYWGDVNGPSASDTTHLEIAGQSEAAAVADLDRDGYLDILAGSDNGNLYVFWGGASGYSSSNRTSVFVNGKVGHNIVIADLDKDGFGDVTLSLWSRNRNPIIYWGPERNPRSIQWLDVSPNNPHGVTVADLNEDGWLDIVYTGYDTVATAWIYYGGETGFSVSRRELIHPGMCYGGSAAVLWNADKHLDLLFFRGNWGSNQTWLPRVFTSRLDTFPHFSDSRATDIGNTPLNASGGFVADLNRDGYQDVFVNNMLADSVSVILWGPDFSANTHLPVNRDHHGLWRKPGSIYSRGPDALYYSSIYDAGLDSAVGTGTCSWLADEPLGSWIGIEVRSGNTAIPDQSWTSFRPILYNGGTLPSEVKHHRFLQYRTTFGYSSPCHLPALYRIDIGMSPIAAIDVAVSAIASPTGVLDSGTAVSPQVLVTNRESSAPLIHATLRIGVDYTQTVVDSLGPLESRLLTFTDWRAQPVGLQTVRCSVWAAGDRVPTNDTLSDTVLVRVYTDVAPVAILAPPVAVESGSIWTPLVTATNFGQRTESFPISLAIGDDYFSSRAATLAPGQTDTITFDDWTASPGGFQSVVCFASLGDDQNRTNDTLRRSVQVYTHIDAATIAIVAPADTIDSGDVVIPRARIANLGTGPAFIPVYLTIEPAYTNSMTVLVAPGETATVAFTNWVADPPGLIALRCSTGITGDENRANDTTSSTVIVARLQDAAALAIIAPSGDIDSAAIITPICQIRNNSPLPTLIPVRLTIGANYDQTAGKVLPAASTDTIHFPTWTALPVGPVQVRCSTALGGDRRPGNDTISQSVFIGRRTDAAAIRLLIPVGSIDSGTSITPLCSIVNHSTQAELIPVRMRIAADYSQTKTRLLLPGQSDTISFPAWTATEVGIWTAQCSTMLTGDRANHNDAASSEFTVVRYLDAAALEVISPAGEIDSGTLLSPALRAANLGPGTIAVPIHCRIEPSYHESLTVQLASGETAIVVMPEWTAQPLGNLDITGFTALPDDRLTTNDTTRSAVEVRAQRILDVGVSAILAPVGTVDSGTAVVPRAVVSNHGNVDTTFNVSLWVGLYSRTVSATVPAGECDTAVFPVWTAVPCGSTLVACWTHLVDANRTNDTARSVVSIEPLVDALPLAIHAPAGSVDSGATIVPAVTIRNAGARYESIAVRLSIEPGYGDWRSFALGAGETARVTFTEWRSSPCGDLTIRCSTALSGDRHPANDTISGRVHVRRRFDAASVAVLAPRGRVDSGTTVTPGARIANLGTGAATIPVLMRIGADWADTASFTLQAGETTDVEFAGWTAAEPGWQPVRCSTLLDRDELAGNDAADDSVLVAAMRDAAAELILAPTGGADSGSSIVPACRVLNSGTGDVVVPVRLAIAPNYVAFGEISLRPGEAGEVLFDEWIAQPLGTHAVRCSTMLDGDNVGWNDTVSAVVTVRTRIDVAAIVVLTPRGHYDSGATVTPVCSIANCGTRADLITTRLRIGSNYIQTRAKLLAPGQRDTVAFRDWIASPVGSCAVRCTVRLSGDENPANDTADATVTIGRRFNATALAILVPTDTLDSGTVVTPVCRIANLSTGEAAIPVHLTIGDSYSAIRVKSLPAGATDTVGFANWVAHPVGQLLARCSTALAGDTLTADDTVVAEVLVRRRTNAAAIAIIAPQGTLDSGSATTPVAAVANLGTGTALIPVMLTIDPDYHDSQNVAVEPGETTRVRFADWTASPLGLRTLRCSTCLPNDGFPADDTATSVVRVHVLVDVGAAAVLSPAGQLDSGLAVFPRVLVGNYGRRDETCRLHLALSDGYRESMDVAVSVDSSAVAELPEWIAASVGPWLATAWTELAADSIPENDTARAGGSIGHRIDAAAIAVLAPLGACDSGATLTPSALIVNRGTTRASIPSLFTIDNGYASTRTTDLAPGEWATIEYDEWRATPMGRFAVRCSVALTGDSDPENNVAIDSVIVGPFLDAAAVSIIAPSGSVDSGRLLTPVCRIRNNSTTAETVPVLLTIGPDYADRRLVALGPSAEQDVSFAPWAAIDTGMVTARCSASLAGDRLAANDTTSAAALVRARIDAAALAVIAPADTADSGAVITPRLLVTNLSQYKLPIPVNIIIDDDYAESTSVVLAAGASREIAFPDWTAAPAGMLSITGYTALNRDIDLANDTARAGVLVMPRRDLAVVALLAPTDSVDSGETVVPSALVANLGHVAESSAVVMSVSPAWADTQSFLAAPGETISVTFGGWTASPCGLLAVRCSTSVPGDRESENDVAAGLVFVTARRDAGVTDIYAPLGTVDSGATVRPFARIANYGRSAAVIPVHMRIGDDYAVHRVKTIDPGAKDTITFDTWNATTLGEIAVCCSTGMAADDNPANDCRREAVMVIARRDAAVEVILAPVGRLDSGALVTPAAVVANYGVSPAQLPVRLRIAGTGYDTVASLFVAAGASDTVLFPYWTASICGTFAVRCSVGLEDDPCRENDVQQTSVTVGVTRDAAALAIVAPQGVIDSGQPVVPLAVVASYSTSPVEAPVILRIGTDYTRSQRIWLAPGAIDTVTFPAWYAHARGVIPLSCSTALYGDCRPKNDIIRCQVAVTRWLDASVRAILLPAGEADSGRGCVPAALVANLGPEPAVIPVRFRISDGYESELTQTVASGACDTFYFDRWDAPRNGHFAVRCTSALEGDWNDANDWRDGAVEVRWRDVAPALIISPAGRVPADSAVSPAAVVTNCGIFTENVPVIFRAGPRYSEIGWADSLAPGESATVTFPPLLIGVGELAISCSTALAGDMEPANDVIRATVFGAGRSLILVRDSAQSSLPGATVSYRLTCTNSGNTTDTIDLLSADTRPDWVVSFCDSTGTVLDDANQNGMPDLGGIESGASRVFAVRIGIPLGENGLVTDSTLVTVRSGRDPGTVASVRLRTSVIAVSDLLIEPDTRGSAAPGQTRIHTLVVTNLGNTPDHADVSRYSQRQWWAHELRDAEGKSLGDINRNGIADIGPLAPYGGRAELRLHVTPGGWSRLGTADTTRLLARSFADPSVTDEARVITDVAGGVIGLDLEPNLAAVIGVGETASYTLTAKTSGNVHAIINVAGTAARAGWLVELCDEIGEHRLGDADFDGNPDLGYVLPSVRSSFTVRVAAPPTLDLESAADSLFTCLIPVRAWLAGDAGVTDSVTLTISAVPRFAIRNWPNSFRERTRFILSVPRSGRINLTVYDRLGQAVRRLARGNRLVPGIHAIEWDGTNDHGRRLAPGIYVYAYELVPDRGEPERTVRKAVLTH